MSTDLNDNHHHFERRPEASKLGVVSQPGSLSSVRWPLQLEYLELLNRQNNRKPQFGSRIPLLLLNVNVKQDQRAWTTVVMRLTLEMAKSPASSATWQDALWRDATRLLRTLPRYRGF